MALSLGELAERTGAELHGDGNCSIDGVANLKSAIPGTISFLANPHFRAHLSTTAASAVILRRDDLAACPVDALVSDNPYLTYARAAALLHPPRADSPGIHPSASIAETARVSNDAHIGAQSVVEEGVVIEADVVIGPGCLIEQDVVIKRGSRLIGNVTICHGTEIGHRVLIHPGAVIGSDGFGFANDHGVWIKIPQLGRVRLGDDVEIGANTTIDRGALEDTVLEDGVKVDNLVQVGHNVEIGAHSAIAGCVGISGSAKIGKHCTLAGGVGVVGHLSIADHVQVTGMSMVTKSIREPGVYSAGMPLQPNRSWHKNAVRFKQVDAMARRLRAVEKRLDKYR